MKLIRVGLIGWALVFLPSSSHADQSSSAEVASAGKSEKKVTKRKKIPWNKVNDDDGLTIWNRDIPNSDVREVKAEKVVDVSVDKVWKAIDEIEKYTEFMPYLTEVSVLSRKGNTVVAYHRLDPPLVSERDYTLTIRSYPKPAKGYFYRHWVATNDKGPAPKEDLVRVTICEGSWTVSSMGPNRTRLVYWLHTHPGGSIPNWIANKANSVSLPDMFEAIVNRALNPSWKSN